MIPGLAAAQQAYDAAIAPDLDTCATEGCNSSCDPHIGLCEPCLADAEHDAKGDGWRDE